MQTREQRKHFRIDDSIDFSYIIIDDQAPLDDKHIIRQLFDDSSLRHYLLIQQFRQLETQSVDILHRVSHENPDITAILKQLNHKIELLAQTLLLSDKNVLTDVNLSLGGMAFPGDTFIAIGQSLKVRITTLPSYEHFIAKAKVIYCKAKSNQAYKVIIKFEALTEEQENLLNQHIMHAQSRHAANNSSTNYTANQQTDADNTFRGR